MQDAFILPISYSTILSVATASGSRVETQTKRDLVIMPRAEAPSQRVDAALRELRKMAQPPVRIPTPSRRGSNSSGDRTFSLMVRSPTVHDITVNETLGMSDQAEASLEEIVIKYSEDLIIEPVIPHYPGDSFPRLREDAPDTQANASAALNLAPFNLVVVVRSGAAPLSGVRCWWRPRGQARWNAGPETDATGRSLLHLPYVPEELEVLALPWHGHWARLVQPNTNAVYIDLPPLPGFQTPPWWQELTRRGPGRGQGVRVAVVDTGLAPHRALAHVQDAGAFLKDDHLPGQGRWEDLDGHGTHVAGIIGGRATAPGLAGLAPDCTLLAMRVFPAPNSSADQASIANAIRRLATQEGVHCINLSLGAANRSAIIHAAIRRAQDLGVLCIAATGNEARNSLSYPAALEETVAVTALGKEGTVPGNTIDGNNVPSSPMLHGRDGLFLAAFSNHGQGVDCCAPGVGIISCAVKNDGWTAMSGTSMAAPLATGVLATILSSRPDIRDMPPTRDRCEAMRHLLHSSCEDVGLQQAHQGNGLATCP